MFLAGPWEKMHAGGEGSQDTGPRPSPHLPQMRSHPLSEPFTQQKFKEHLLRMSMDGRVCQIRGFSSWLHSGIAYGTWITLMLRFHPRAITLRKISGSGRQAWVLLWRFPRWFCCAARLEKHWSKWPEVPSCNSTHCPFLPSEWHEEDGTCGHRGTASTAWPGRINVYRAAIMGSAVGEAQARITVSPRSILI